MTGEITLRGRVLPIGGVKEKLLAAHQAGIKHVIIPAANDANLEDVPDSIMDDLTVTTVKDFSEVVKMMLLDADDRSAFIPPTPDDAVSPSAQV